MLQTSSLVQRLGQLLAQAKVETDSQLLGLSKRKEGGVNRFCGFEPDSCQEEPGHTPTVHSILLRTGIPEGSSQNVKGSKAAEVEALFHLQI